MEITRKTGSEIHENMQCVRYIITGEGDNNELKYYYEYTAFKAVDESNWTVIKRNALKDTLQEVVLHADFLDFLIAESARKKLSSE